MRRRALPARSNSASHRQRSARFVSQSEFGSDDENPPDTLRTCEAGLVANQRLGVDTTERHCKQPGAAGDDCLVLPVDTDGCLDGLRCAGRAVGRFGAADTGTCVDADAVGQLGDPCDPNADVCEGDLVCSPTTSVCD